MAVVMIRETMRRRTTLTRPEEEAAPEEAAALQPQETPVLGGLSHELLHEMLEWLAGEDLLALACANFGLSIFCSEDPLWMALCLRQFGTSTAREATWRATWARARGLRWVRTDSWRPRRPREDSRRATLPAKRPAFVSTFLQNRWFCCHAQLDNFAPSKEAKSVEHVHISNRGRLSPRMFALEFDLPRKPVVITGAIESWPARRKWTLDQLAARFGDDFKWSISHGVDDVGQLEMTMAQYAAYLREQVDEVPLYIFDASFGEKAPELLDEYSIKTFQGLFADDYLSVLDGENRPRYRWLVAGPARTGAPWHKDPNYTSAWNSLLQGRKRWALYPPDKTPPGVGVYADGSECGSDGGGSAAGEDGHVATPTSLRWFLDVYPQLEEGDRPFEVVQNAGETIFVPAGWWHLVLNLEDTVSVTQNFVSGANLRAASEVLWSERGGGFVELWADKLAQQVPRLTATMERVLLPLRAGFDSSAAYASSFRDLELWTARLSAVLRHHSLVEGDKFRDPPLATSAFEALSRRLNPTFAHVESGLVIKFFSHFAQGDLSAGRSAIDSPHAHDGWTAYKNEVQFLSRPEILKEGAEARWLPRLVGHGVYFGEGHGEPWRWPYVIETRVAGASLGVTRSRLEREYDLGAAALQPALCNVAAWLGARLRKLHDQASSSSFRGRDRRDPDTTGYAGVHRNERMVPYARLLKMQRRFALSSHVRKNVLPRRLLESMEDFIASEWRNLCSVAPHEYVNLHGDVQEENIMVESAALSACARTEATLRHVWGPMLRGEETYLEALVHRLVHEDKLRLEGWLASNPDTLERTLGALGVPAGLRCAVVAWLSTVGTAIPSAGFAVAGASEAAQEAPALLSPCGLIDFGDARRGDALFDFVAVQVSALRCDAAAWAHFLQSYGATSHAHVTSRPLESFSRVLMCLALLHPAGRWTLPSGCGPRSFPRHERPGRTSLRLSSRRHF